MKIQLKHSNVLTSGAAKEPTSANMLDGEIAVNYNSADPSLFIKDSLGNIVRIAGKDNLSLETFNPKIDIQATGPTSPEIGNLYFDTDDERLYIYYNDGTGAAWKDASKESFDTSVIPDTTNSAHQSGTLDDRYVNSNGDTVTGLLTLNAGITLNSSDVILNNGKITFEGSVADAFETDLNVVNPTADRTILLPDVSGTLITTGDSGSITSSMIADGTIADADISSSAGISLSKLGSGTLPSTVLVNSANIADGSIVDADVSSSAAIGLSKLATGALPTGITITSAQISGGIDPGDISTGTLDSGVKVDTANLLSGAVTDSKISTSAGIQVSKLADGSSYQLLITNAAGTGVEWASNIDVPGTLDVTGNATFDGNATVAGNFTASGSTISLDANIVNIKDNNVQLNTVASPSDINANDGGLTLKGSTDKTIKWLSASNAWTSSEHFNVDSGKAYYVNGTQVLSGTTLGAGVTSSSLTGVGTISSGVWQGTAISDVYLATLTTSGKVANSATTATNLNSANAIVARDASGDFVARNITATLLGNANTATRLQTARTISLTGDLTGSASFDGSANVSINTTATFTGTTNLAYNSSTRTVTSDTGTDATIPLFNSSTAGLAGASGGGTTNFLRADGSWAAPTGTATNLGYTSSTSTITSSTGTGVALPTFTANAAGLTPASGGGTSKYLRSDGNWIVLGSSVTTIGGNPPSNPQVGDSWYDSDDGRMYLYYQDTDSSQWVEANPSWNGSIPTGSILPSYLSTGHPSWNTSGDLTITGKFGANTSSPSAMIHVTSSSTSETGVVGIKSEVTGTTTQYHQTFVNPNGVQGKISTSSTGTTYATTSDYRLKTNVVNLTGAIARVKLLQPKRFNFISDPDQTVDGFIAHEAQTVVPEAVTGTLREVDEDGNPVMQCIDQSKLVPLLTAALQEAVGTIESLEQRIIDLESRLS